MYEIALFRVEKLLWDHSISNKERKKGHFKILTITRKICFSHTTYINPNPT